MFRAIGGSKKRRTPRHFWKAVNLIEMEELEAGLSVDHIPAVASRLPPETLENGWSGQPED